MAEEQAIPEETRAEAKLVVDAIIEEYRKWYRIGPPFTVSMVAGPPIARALLAAELRGREQQKEADARIAEDEDGHFSVWGEDRNTAVAQQTCRDIAAAIRNQGQPT